MTELAESELLRARWRRALDRHAIDSVDRADFALGGLATRLRTPTVQILWLPTDPEANALQIDDALWTWIEAHRFLEVDGQRVDFGFDKCPTAHAVALVKRNNDPDLWNSYLAVNGSGVVEFGLGECGGSDQQNAEGDQSRSFYLVSIVTYTWALLKFISALNEWFPNLNPTMLTVALKGTKDASLANLGEGFIEPGEFRGTVGGCPESNLLWHFELDKLPDDDGQQRLAFVIGDQIENAWGGSQSRYLANRGERKGRLDFRYIA